MTDAQLRDQAVTHLKATTISYPEWVKRVAAGRYTPKDGSTTEWGKAFAALEQISATPPPPPGGRTPLPPNGPFRVETGDHFYRDGDGLLTEKLDVSAAPGYGIGNQRWNGGTPNPLPPPSTGTWVLRDCKARNVSATPPRSMNGTGEVGFQIGERTQGERLEAHNCAWMGMVTLANVAGSRFTDVYLHDGPHVDLYIEHGTDDVEFRRSSFGKGTTTRDASPVNAEWWYEDAIYGARLPHGTKAGSRNVRFIDCEFYCPLSPNEGAWDAFQVAGVFLDAGSYDYLFQNCRFYGPGRSVGHPRNTMDASKPNRFVDCVFENALGGPYLHDNAVG